MQFSVLPLYIATMCLAGTANAANFHAFPENLTCNISKTATKTITRAELQSLVVNGRRTLLEQNASNMAAGPACATLRDPLYTADAPGFASVAFVYKQSTGDYTFCSGLGFDVTGNGYGTLCWSS